MAPKWIDDKLPDLNRTQLLPDKLEIAEDAFVASTAILRGHVSVGSRSSVWFNAIIRGDLAPVIIGEDSNIQDGSILHVEVDGPAIVGNRVTVGHMAVVHGCTVEDDCLIGIGAKVLSGSTIGKESIIASGSLVKEGWSVPERSLVMGVPGRVVRQVTEKDLERSRRNWKVYVQYAASYRRTEGARPGS